MGGIFVAKGEYKKAIEHLELAIKYKPAFDESYSNYGVALARLGKYSEASKYFMRSAVLNPSNMDAYFNLAVCCADQKEYNKAIDLLLYLNKKPNYFNKSNKQLGIVYYERAIDYLNKNDFRNTYDDMLKARDCGYPVKPEYLNLVRNKAGF